MRYASKNKSNTKLKNFRKLIGSFTFSSPMNNLTKGYSFMRKKENICHPFHSYLTLISSGYFETAYPGGGGLIWPPPL